MAPEEGSVPRKSVPAGDASHGIRKAELSGESNERLVHELRVHQFELKVQNEELRRAQEELCASRDRYLALYEFAPVGYFTLDRNGSILEANLTAASLFGMQRSNLQGGRFSEYVSPADRNRFHLYYGQLGKPGGTTATEIRIAPPDRAEFDARLEGAPARARRRPWRPVHAGGKRYQQQQAERSTPCATATGGKGHRRTNRREWKALGPGAAESRTT